MEPRHVALERGRLGIETLEPRVVPSAVVKIYLNPPEPADSGEDVLAGDNAGITRGAGGGYLLTGVSHSATDASYG